MLTCNSPKCPLRALNLPLHINIWLTSYKHVTGQIWAIHDGWGCYFRNPILDSLDYFMLNTYKTWQQQQNYIDVLRDIDNIKKDVRNFVQMSPILGRCFFEGEAPDSYGRMQRIYYLSASRNRLNRISTTTKDVLRRASTSSNSLAMRLEISTCH